MSILGDISQALPLPSLPPHYSQVSTRLSHLEGLRSGIASYLTNVDNSEPIPMQAPPIRSILEDEFNELQPQNDDFEEDFVEIQTREEVEIDPILPDFQPIETYQKPKKPQKRGKRRVLPKPPPKRDFIRENILNLRTIRKSPSPLGGLGEQWVEGLLGKREERRVEKEVVLRGILKEKSGGEGERSVEEIRGKVEGEKVVRNRKLLSALFDKVADTFALHWEEAADALISDLLEEEAFFLTSLETPPTEPQPVSLNLSDLLSLVTDYRQEADAVSRKYCVD